MPSEFSTNIQQIAAELKLMDKKFAVNVKRAIRKTVAEAGAATTEAIRAEADAKGLNKAKQGTSMRLLFSERTGGAKIITSRKIAPYARPLEQGTRGSGGEFNRHPVFERTSEQRKSLQKKADAHAVIGFVYRHQIKKLGTTWVNQPTRPYFYSSAKKMEPLSELKLLAAVDLACEATGFTR